MKRAKYTCNFTLKKFRSYIVDNDFDTCAIHVWADYEFFSNVGDSDEAQVTPEYCVLLMA